MTFEHDIDGLFKTYQSLLPMKSEDEARLWEKFRLDWNYNSNRIEGNTLTRSETRALLIDGVEPARIRKDILQMRSHDKAIDYLLEIVKADTPLTEKDIKDLNALSLHSKYMIKTITPDGNITQKEIIPGTYKTTPNVVLKTDGTEHKYADPFEVGARMEATIKRVNAYIVAQNIPLPDFLAELHQDFIHTHPFDDGNGRVVRLILNYVCLKCGWPPVIIKSDKRPEYIDALERWNDGEKATFRELIRHEMIWSLEKSIKAARGEDIEDPDDIDKEIDIYVNEENSIFITRSQAQKEILNRVTHILDAKLKKFSPLFSRYEFKKTDSSERSLNFLSRNLLPHEETFFVFLLEEFKPRLPQTLSAHITLFLSCDHSNTDTLTSIYELWGPDRNNKSELWVNGQHNIPIWKNNQEITNDLNAYCSKLIRDLLNDLQTQGSVSHT